MKTLLQELKELEDIQRKLTECDDNKIITELKNDLDISVEDSPEKLKAALKKCKEENMKAQKQIEKLTKMIKSVVDSNPLLSKQMGPE